MGDNLGPNGLSREAKFGPARRAPMQGNGQDDQTVDPRFGKANPPQATYIDVADVVFDSTIPYDVRFFQSLDRIVQSEPWLERDRAMIDPLKLIGVEKGKTFNPDEKTRKALNAGAVEAKAWPTDVMRLCSRRPSTKEPLGRCRPYRL